MTTATAERPTTIEVEGHAYVIDEAGPLTVEHEGETYRVRQADPGGVGGTVETEKPAGVEVEPFRPPVAITSVIGFPTASEWAAMSGMANAFARSGIVPEKLRQKPDDCMVIVMRARALRLDPSVAIEKIHVIKGTPAMAAELMRALVLRAGFKIWPGNPDERPGERPCDRTTATVYAVRDGERHSSTFTLDDAMLAGVVTKIEDGKVAGVANGKDTWRTSTKSMLIARATSTLCRWIFPDVLAGVTYVPEELDAVVDDDGEVIDVVEVDADREYPAAGLDPNERPLKQTDLDRIKNTIAQLEPARQVIVRADWLHRMATGEIPSIQHTRRGHLDTIEAMISAGRDLTDEQLGDFVELATLPVRNLWRIPDQPPPAAETEPGQACEICGDTSGPFDVMGDPDDRDSMVECQDRTACRERLRAGRGHTTAQEPPDDTDTATDPSEAPTDATTADPGTPDAPGQLPLD